MDAGLIGSLAQMKQIHVDATKWLSSAIMDKPPDEYHFKCKVSRDCSLEEFRAAQSSFIEFMRLFIDILDLFRRKYVDRFEEHKEDEEENKIEEE